MGLLDPKPGDTYKEFAAKHAPFLAQRIAELQNKVLIKGLTAHLEVACELQDRINKLEALLQEAVVRVSYMPEREVAWHEWAARVKDAK